PSTDQISEYRLRLSGSADELRLLDTVGYSHQGPKADDLRATQETARRSDLLILVLHATNPGREADRLLLKGLHQWAGLHPDLRLPPILIVLTHIDLLSPALEWSPPYHFEKPERWKEKQVRMALDAVAEQLPGPMAGCVPVCTSTERLYGLQEYVLPAILA